MRTAEIIRVAVARNADGWYVATSDDLPGLYVAHPEIDEVVTDVPETIRALYLANYEVEVDVVAGAYGRGPSEGMPWITIPAHVAARGSGARC